jgi:hypothetical protein
VGGTALNGEFKIKLFSGDNCGVTSGSALSYEKSTTLSNATTPQTLATDNTSVKVSASSSVSWLVTFTSSDPLVSSSSHCEKTSLTITN